MDITTWTIPQLLQLASGYWAPAALQAGVKLDLFSPLANGGRSAATVAQERGCDPRATGLLLDALAALGLLTKDADNYALTTFSAVHLVRSAPGYLGHIIMHHHHLMAGWAQLPSAVRSGAPIRESIAHAPDGEVLESFLMGMFNLANQLAPHVAAAIDLSSCRRLIDLGGGPGTYAIHFCLQNPQLTATVYDLPTSRSFAEQTIARFGLGDRVGFSAGDFLVDEVPGGYDVAWLSHILHSEGEAGCGKILARGAAALQPGGKLLVQEFILDDTKDGPLFPALFSLNMLLGTAAGRAYSQAELVAMMAAAGLTAIRRLPLELPNGAGVLCGEKR